MECYDARVIEGCCVFSYTVEGPSRPAVKKEETLPVPAVKRKAPCRRTVARTNAWKKIMLQVVLLLLVPFAFAVDMFCLVAKKTFLAIYSLVSARPIRRTASILGAMSCVSLISAVLLML